MILTVTFNPSIDRALFVESLKTGDTNRVVRTEVDAGGKGVNLSRVAHELGADTLAIGFLGGSTGSMIRSTLDGHGVAHDFLQVAGETRTNLSIEETGEERPPTTLNERGPELCLEDVAQLRSHCQLYAEKHQGWVCLCGSVPPGVPKAAYLDFGKMLKAQNCKLLVDADGELLSEGIKCKPDLIKPNIHEAERLLGVRIESEEGAISALKELVAMLDEDGMAILSMGEQGALLSAGGAYYRGMTPQVDAKSTIGSGDSMLGAFLWAQESRLSIEESFRYGLAAGAATAMTDGSQIGQKGEITRLFTEATVELIR